MTKILILGAHGATAQIVTQRLLDETDDELVLFLRHARRLSQLGADPRVTLVEGDVQNQAVLVDAMRDVDLVYSNVGGVDLAASTQAMIAAMHAAGKTRLIFYSALGALHEVPSKFGEWNEQAIKDFLPGFRESDRLLRADADIDTTQIRPAWLTNGNEVDYEVTGIDEPFKGTEVSRQSVADFVVRLLKQPDQYHRTSVGLDRPGTDGDRPAWI